MDKNVREFLAFVKGECGRHEINFNFSDKRFVLANGNIRCNGYFNAEEKMLAVAAGQSEEKCRILVHEYAHMTQWLANCKAWNGGDSEYIVNLWIEDKVSFNAKQLKMHIRNSRDVELDCERRTLRLIKKWNLPIDPKEYVKNANAYIYFWTYVGISRKWYKIGKESYNTPGITRIMPDHLNCDYDSIPQPVLKLFKKIVNE